MSASFNIDEVFEIAEQIERNGAKYYRKAAGYMEDPEAVTLLEDLAAMEDEHEQVFAGLRTRLAASEFGETVFDPDNEAAQYLQALADGAVFDPNADPADRLKGTESLGEILEIAITLEKESINYYLGVKEVVPESLGRDRVDTIIKEEMGHVTLLTNRKRRLTGS
ncbi:MAG TPA: rubrerythrin [Bacteroidetes bacterium]|nr:rubrerythrin [Bacteroidota bacterium]